MVDAVRPLVVIAAVEAAAGMAGLVAVMVAVSAGPARGLEGGGAGLAAAEVVMWLLAAGALGLVWRGMSRRRRAARTPFLLVQAFVLVTIPAFLGSDSVGYRAVGFVLGFAAVAGLVLGLRPAVGRSLA